MKFTLTLMLAAIVVTFGMLDANAQSSVDKAFERKLAEKNVPGAQLGSLVCENADGKLVLCSGDLEESIAGIVTNVPYVTLNKPATPSSSKSIFSAMVSAEAGPVSKGDFLTAGNNGQLVRCDENRSNFAYAVALENQAGSGIIRVKVLSK